MGEKPPINVFRPKELLALADMMEAAEDRLIRAIGSGTGQMMNDLGLLVAGAVCLRAIAEANPLIPSGEQIKARMKEVGMNQEDARRAIRAATGHSVNRLMFMSWTENHVTAPKWFDLDLIDWKHIIETGKARMAEQD